MSMASKCDLCGKTYVPVRGALTLDVNHYTGKDGAVESWSDVDLCVECAGTVIDIIRPALDDFGVPKKKKGGSDGKN